MQELVRILKEEYGLLEKGLDELLSMVVETRAQDLVEKIKEVSNAKSVIPKILHDIRQHHDFDGYEDETGQKKQIEQVIQTALSSYDYIRIIPDEDMDYTKIIQEIMKYENMDFVAHYKNTLFEPLDYNEWNMLKPCEECELILYTKDLDNKNRSPKVLEKISSLIGKGLKKAEPFADYESRLYEIVCSIGIHARPASLIVQTANKYDMDIKVGEINNPKDEYINGKGIMGLLMLGATKGTKLEFLCNGNEKERENFYAELESIKDTTDKGEEIVFDRYKE